jgi:Caspase domain
MAKYALLIGVSEYQPGLNTLPGAVQDVKAMQRVLQHSDMGDFAEFPCGHLPFYHEFSPLFHKYLFSRIQTCKV